MKALHTVCGIAIGVGIFGAITVPGGAWFVCAIAGAAVVVLEAILTQ